MIPIYFPTKLKFLSYPVGIWHPCKIPIDTMSLYMRGDYFLKSYFVLKIVNVYDKYKLKICLVYDKIFMLFYHDQLRFYCRNNPPLPPSWEAVRARLHAGGRALSVSGPVRRTPSPGCPMTPPQCVLNNKHPCNPKPVCRGISSAFLPRAAGGRIQKAMSYVCHISGICSAPMTVIYQVYTWYISFLGP